MQGKQPPLCFEILRISIFRGSLLSPAHLEVHSLRGYRPSPHSPCRHLFPPPQSLRLESTGESIFAKRDVDSGLLFLKLAVWLS